MAGVYLNPHVLRTYYLFQHLPFALHLLYVFAHVLAHVVIAAVPYSHHEDEMSVVKIFRQLLQFDEIVIAPAVPNDKGRTVLFAYGLSGCIQTNQF